MKRSAKRPKRRAPARREELREDVEAFVDRLYAECDRLRPLVPDVDDHDLLLILRNIMKPFGSGKRFFLRELRPGVYVF